MDFAAENLEKPYAFSNEIHLDDTKDVTPDQWTQFNGELVLRNVVTPSLIAFAPEPGVPDLGEVVVVAPGGGMLVLAIENEGVNIAKKLAAAGYTAYVLKYRVLSTQTDPAAFKQECMDFYADKMSNGFGRADSHLDTKLATDDLVAALAKIKTLHSDKPVKVHYVGFSAGAKVGLDALSLPGTADLLDTLGLIYFSLECPLALDTTLPPLFAALANDDPLFARSGFGLIEKWQQAEQEVELHLFKNGGHGFAGRPNGSTSDAWFELYMNWLKLSGQKK
jgi:dienelactone hydrolase